MGGRSSGTAPSSAGGVATYEPLRGALGLLLREQRKIPGAQVKGGQKTQVGCSWVLGKKINQNTTLGQRKQTSFPSLAGQQVSRWENYELWNQEDVGPTTVLSPTA